MKEKELHTLLKQYLVEERRREIRQNAEACLEGYRAGDGGRQTSQLQARPSVIELGQLAERWRPYRSVAARMLWQYYLAEQNRL
ncbi:MAG: hypothetical protein ACXW3C_17905 [Pyrinomonadaceae bacterium]